MSHLRRREFLRRSLMASMASGAFASMLPKLGMAWSASLPAGPRLRGEEYRALVCIYLYGGNDCYNTVIPRDGQYAVYAQTRTNLAVPQANILPLTTASPPQGGELYGLHPEMPGLQQMFNSGKAAIIANVGPLVRPITRAMYQTPGTLLPAQLFSHSDQTVLWQTPRADTSARTGWGGRLADIFYSTNPNQVLSMNTSLDGENVFQAGVQVSPYFLSSEGVEEIGQIDTGGANCNGPDSWNRRRCLSFHALLNQDYAHPFERAYVEKTQRTIETSAQVRAALALYPRNHVVFRPFWDALGLPWNPDNLPALPRLASQLLMIARMIRAREDLQMTRQLFFAGLGGFDTHGNQLADHPGLLRDLSQSVKAFYDVLADPLFGLGDKVTTFTASEFGRTLTNNGDGTDHGWGGHHFVFGDAVIGQRIYGRMPSLATQNNPEDAGWGQIIPSLSVDQYAATITRWYGLSDQDRDAIFPNLQYFVGPIPSIEGPDLGFMGPPPA